ncbi:MAG: hypothetical protein ACK4M7_10235, partial [Burkholderiales bacterium]
VGGGISTTRTAEVNISANTPPVSNQYYRFKESFNFSEMELKSRGEVSMVDEEVILNTLFRLFRDILIDGADIVPRGELTDKKIVIEASFQPPVTAKARPQMFLPLRGVYDKFKALSYNLQGLYDKLEMDLRNYLRQVRQHSNYNDLLRLIILAGHEYGHFLSFQRGFHNPELKVGLSLLYTRQVGESVDKYTYLVFSEEATAWRFAKDKLTRYGFNEWEAFDNVKKSSLKEYYRVLGFDKDVSIDTLCKISMLDIDLK